MPRILTAKRVLKARKTPGRYPDGTVPGLYLQVTTPRSRAARGAASWVLRFERGGVERMAGIGPLSVVSLAEARNRAKAMRLGLLDGVDPIDARKAARTAAALEKAKSVSFEQAAEAYWKAQRPKWRSAVHAQEYIGSLRRYAFPVIGRLPVSVIDTALVVRVLEPLWERAPETAARVRGRIESVLDWAAVRGYRAAGDNPARWKGHIEHLLPARRITDVEHFAALDHREMAALMNALRQCKGVSARALEFTIHTASRSGETLGARWGEIDLGRGVWVIPAGRTKAGKQHRIPLSKPALTLLKNLPGKSANGFVFIGNRASGGLGKDALQKALARIRPGITVHGFRAAFKTWAGERTNFARETIEIALAHKTGDQTEEAYERGDKFEKRWRLMQAWSDYLAKAPAAKGAVVPMRARS